MNEYPTNWLAVAELVKNEAGWKCARCNHRHDPDSGHTLTVHHFDGDKANCERWNLMPLCQRCHLSVQARVKPRQGFMGTPSVWAMPYIAGMIDAGKTPEPIGFNLLDWIVRHDQAGRPWPRWAPTPEGVRA